MAKRKAEESATLNSPSPFLRCRRSEHADTGTDLELENFALGIDRNGFAKITGRDRGGTTVTPESGNDQRQKRTAIHS